MDNSITPSYGNLGGKVLADVHNSSSTSVYASALLLWWLLMRTDCTNRSVLNQVEKVEEYI